MTAGPYGPPSPTAAAMALLRSGVPLTLLLDLALGPRSEELMSVERPAHPVACTPA